MKKKILSLFFVLVICLSMTIPVYAEGEEGEQGIIPVTDPGSGLTDDAGPINSPGEGLTDDAGPINNPGDNSVVSPGPGPALPGERMSRMVDEADVLSDSEEANLLAKLDELSVRQEFDVVIITITSLGGQGALDFADDYFLNYGHGFGDNRDGILFMVSPEERDWAFAVSGFGRDAFTYAGQEFIVNKMLYYLSDDYYYDAFNVFIEQSDKFITQAREDKPFEEGNLPKEAGILEILIPIILGIFIAFAIVSIMKGQLKSVYMQAKADDYERPGSMNITNQNDTFLYSNVTKSARPKENNSGGGGGGSSSGGSSGKY